MAFFELPGFMTGETSEMNTLRDVQPDEITQEAFNIIGRSLTNAVNHYVENNQTARENFEPSNNTAGRTKRLFKQKGSR